MKRRPYFEEDIEDLERRAGLHRPQVLVSVKDDKEFFVVDENTTAEELIRALRQMKNGHKILHGLFVIQQGRNERTEVDYSLQSP